MLVNHLLLPVSHKDDHEAVKSRNDPPELEAIHQKQRHGNLVPADLLENGILQIHGFVHMYTRFLVHFGVRIC